MLAPELASSWHGHVEAREGRGDARVLGIPIRDDEALRKRTLVSVPPFGLACSCSLTWNPSSVFRRPFTALLFWQPKELFSLW